MMKLQAYKCDKHSRTYHFKSGNTTVISGITAAEFVNNEFIRLFHKDGISEPRTTTIFYDKVEYFTSNEKLGREPGEV